MNRKTEILSKIESIPSMPAAALEAMRLLQDPDVDMVKLTRAIEYDPGLTSNLLHLANSAYFGGSGSIRSLKDAIVRLGSRCAFQLLVASAVAPITQERVKGYDLPAGALWKHSIAVALGTQKLAAFLNLQPPEHAFTSAILHDIGKVVLGTFVEVDASPIMALAGSEGISFESAEQIILGIDHAEAGAILLESWNLPPSIVEVNREHHHPEHVQGDTLAVDLVHAADVLCLMAGIGLGNDGLNYRPSSKVVSRLQLTTLAAETAVCGILEGLQEFDLFTSDTGR